MKRRQLFEFEDLPWFPARIRDFMTDFLRTVGERFDLFGPVVPILDRLLEQNGVDEVVDLASGGGGQWRVLAKRLAAKRRDVRVTLTDRYPNLRALDFVRQSVPASISVNDGPVDATDVPASLAGVRTMFLSLHHFPPSVATRILADAVKSNAPIAVFEAQQRDVKHVVQFAFSPLMVLVLTPLIRPFSWTRLLFTYLVPVVPLATGWDGIASVFRTYTPDEMTRMAHAADPDDAFTWASAVLAHGPQRIQYLTGQPKR